MQIDLIDEYLKWFNELSKQVNKVFNKNKTSIQIYLVSKLLFEKDKLTVKSIANFLGVSLSSATQILNRMQKQKLIERSFYNMDRRNVFVTLTMNGRLRYKTNKLAVITELDEVFRRNLQIIFDKVWNK